jgi:rhodanese-related sulfurtransferase
MPRWSRIGTPVEVRYDPPVDPQFDGMIFQTHAAELKRRLRFPVPPFRVIDVRPAAEFSRGHIPGAVPSSSISPASLLSEANGRLEIFVVGRGPGDPEVREASLSLLQAGAHRVVELTGGMLEWELQGGGLDRAA